MSQAMSGQNADDESADGKCDGQAAGSPYIPADSWMYTELMRLYSLGYLHNAFLGLRPWTRASVRFMLDAASDDLADEEESDTPEAVQAVAILKALNHELQNDAESSCQTSGPAFQVESVYNAGRAITGTPLHDSFHLGSTVINDYGRPYGNGLNNYSGFSGYVTARRFVLYARGELQAYPSAPGYSTGLAQTLSNLDETSFLNPATGLPYNQPTIPFGNTGGGADFRFVEAYISYTYVNHVISFGKQDEWWGPGAGGAMAFSNGAQNFYAFHLNRTEPLHIPLLSALTGPFRYEFLVGGLQGHTYMPNPGYPGNNEPNAIDPGNPWVHLEKISFRPTSNLEFGFERTVIWGGKGHVPITLHTFLRSFFSVSNTTQAVKFSRDDPGARFGAFDFSYRLPFVRNWLTLYTDSESHDDVSPVDAPRRASYRPGLYLAHVPGVPKLDVRAEGVSTDPPTSRSNGGQFNYWEYAQRQGYTNQGKIFGDWIGREAKGGQAWVTYNLSGNEWIRLSVRNQKNAKDFIPGGTTLDDVGLQLVKRVKKDIEVNGSFTFERWKAPAYLPGNQNVTTTSVQVTWFPEKRRTFQPH